jgi:hypothetical protein
MNFYVYSWTQILQFISSYEHQRKQTNLYVFVGRTNDEKSSLFSRVDADLAADVQGIADATKAVNKPRTVGARTSQKPAIGKQKRDH